MYAMYEELIGRGPWSTKKSAQNLVDVLVMVNVEGGNRIERREDDGSSWLYEVWNGLGLAISWFELRGSETMYTAVLRSIRVAKIIKKNGPIMININHERVKKYDIYR